MKVRSLAEQVLIDIQSLKYEQDSPDSRETFDELFLTAHVRASGLDRGNR